MVQFWILVHVMSAIVAFGPSYAFPIIGAMGGKEPQHANFAARVNEGLAKRLTIPVALTMPITGLLIVWVGQIDLFAQRWLLLAIVLYAIAVSYSIFIQLPAGEEVVRLSGVPPAPGTPPGPPPAIRAAVRKVQRGGMFLTAMVVAIVGLMVTKPF